MQYSENNHSVSLLPATAGARNIRRWNKMHFPFALDGMKSTEILNFFFSVLIHFTLRFVRDFSINLIPRYSVLDNQDDLS